MSKLIEIFFRLFNSFLVLLLIVVIQLRFVSVYLKNIDHLELFNKSTNDIISIKNVELDTWKYFFNLKLSFTDIYISHSNKTFKAIDKVVIALDLHSLYKNKEEPIFYLNISDLDIESLSRRTSTTTSGQSINLNKKTTVEKIIRFLNKKNLTSFKVEVSFKNLYLEKSFDNLQITNISFTNLRLSKDYIGHIDIKFKTDEEIKSLSGFVMRDKVMNEGTINQLFSRTNDKNLIVELYGYINHSFVKDKFKVEPRGFYKLLLTYDPRKKNTIFNGDFRFINIEVDGISPIPAHNIQLKGQYNFGTRELFLKNFSFDLEYLNEMVPIGGSLNITRYSLDLYAFANYSADKELIYHFWPRKGSDVKDHLQNLIVNTKVKNPSINLGGSRENSSYYKARSLDLKFTLENTNLNKNFHRYNYSFASDKIDINITLKSTKLKSEVVYFENDIKINKLDVVIPLRKEEKVQCNFEAHSSGGSIKKIASRYIKNIDKIDGKAKLKINSMFRIIDSSFIDLDLSGLVDLNNLQTIYKGNEHKVDVRNLSLKMKNNSYKLAGDGKYNDINVRNFHLNGAVTIDDKSKIYSADFKVDLSQPRIEELVKKIQSRATGILYVKVSDDRHFHLVLDDVVIENSNLGIAKQAGVAGNIDFRLDDKANLRDINLKIPMLEASGDIDISNHRVDAFNLKLSKFHNSSFSVIYSNNFYSITGDKAHIEDIEKMFRSDKKYEPSNDAHRNNLLNLSIKVGTIYSKQQPVLEDISLKLGFDNGHLTTVDGYTYAPQKKGYVRLYLDEPVFALVVNNLGHVVSKTFNFTSLKKGNLTLYGTICNGSGGPTFSGKLYLHNFKLIESYLLSTILKIYALSGFSVSNIFNMFNNGIKFSNMECSLSGNKNTILFNNCQAFSNAMLLSLGSEIDLKHRSGEIEGLIIPKNFFNAPIIFLQQILSKKGKTLLDGMEDKQNFSITWKKNSKPIVKTNPISFILPSIFSNIFSKKKTVKNDQCHNSTTDLVDSDASR